MTMPDRRRFLQTTLLASAAWAARRPGRAEDGPRKVILDVDLGIDDAAALLLAHYSPQIELVGVTTAFGNTTIEKGTRNTLYLKERFGISAPVHRGAAVPMVQIPIPPPTFVHGVDGLGDVIERIEPSVAAGDLPAAEFIARTVMENPGEVTVISVGPATNLVAARMQEPRVTENVREVIVMGGAAGFAGELGNASTVGEANAWQDPHAMHVLFRSEWPAVMVGLDITYDSDAAFDAAYLARLRERAGDAGAFLEAINGFYMRFYERVRGVRATFQHDSIAVAYAIAPELFTTRRGKVRVVTEGVARGQTIFCPVGHHDFEAAEWAGYATQAVCAELDGGGFRGLFEKTLVDGARGAA